MEIPMTKTLVATAAVAGLLVVGPIAEASAWTRNSTVTTRYGTYTVNGAGGCGGGSCSFNRTVTGPYGDTWTRNGAITRTGPNRYTYWGTATGPYGGSVMRSGNVYVTPGYRYW
jgi:hypothetical protein